MELYRSAIPLLSNTDETIEVDKVSQGHVCIYEFKVYDNEDCSELIEIEIAHLEGTKLGVNFI